MGRDGRLDWLLRASLTQIQRAPWGCGVARLALADYDCQSDMVVAHCHAGLGNQLLDNHEFILSEMPGLSLVAAGREMRVVHELPRTGMDRPHLQAMRAAGLRSSLTVPLSQGDALVGFLFLNATVPYYFQGETLAHLQAIMGVLASTVLREMCRGI